MNMSFMRESLAQICANEDKDDENVMLADLPHLAARSHPAAAVPSMQLLGVSTAALGLSWVLQCGKAKTEVKFEGEVARHM